jgi:hypothetical protein
MLKMVYLDPHMTHHNIFLVLQLFCYINFQI